MRGCIEDDASVIGQACHSLAQGPRHRLLGEQRAVDAQDIGGAHRLDGFRPHPCGVFG